MIENLKRQLEQLEIEHPEPLNKGNYWRGVKVGIKTAINIAEENLILFGVSRSLPTHKEILSKMDELVEKNYSNRTEIEKTNFRIGWQECFSWLAQEPSDNG